MERRLWVSRLKSVDLPTLGRPTMATSGSARRRRVPGTTDLRYVGKTHLQSPRAAPAKDGETVYVNSRHGRGQYLGTV